MVSLKRSSAVPIWAAFLTVPGIHALSWLLGAQPADASTHSHLALTVIFSKNQSQEISRAKGIKAGQGRIRRRWLRVLVGVEKDQYRAVLPGVSWDQPRLKRRDYYRLHPETNQKTGHGKPTASVRHLALRRLYITQLSGRWQQ